LKHHKNLFKNYINRH